MASTLRSPSTPLGPRSALTSPRSVQSPLSGTVTSPTFTTTTSFDQHRLEADLLERPYLPDCWSDERRMAVLFSPFRVRDTNPEGWDLKMNFWTNAISRWCLQTRTVAFSLEDVRRAFLRRDGHQLPHPDCLLLVLSTMKRRVALMTDQELPVARNARSLGRSLPSWSVNSLLLKPLSVGWSLLTSSNAARADSADSGQYSSSSMKSSTASSFTPTSPQEEQPLASLTAETKLFSRETLDLLVESVEGHLKGLNSSTSSPIKPGACLRYHHFTAQLNKTLFAGRPLDEASFAVVIEVAEAKTGARLKTMTLDDGIRIVKISGGGESAAGSEAAINQTDISLIKMEATRELLEAEVDRLSEEADALREEARQALAGRSREKALLLLKRKKRLEAKITAKDTAINNIEAIYQQVLDTHSATAIIRALAYANAVLKQRSGVVLSDLEDTMTAIEDTMSDVAALSSEINRPLATGGDTAGVELDAEEELYQMLKELESKKKEDATLDRLDQLKIADRELSLGKEEEGVSQTPKKQLADLQA
ncbi:Charged multivesicular body protein 7 [Tyrophagus putrescentiae]|nr:Charged multivesicular body protein 7 [Tyrophagus putrescentiae]